MKALYKHDCDCCKFLGVYKKQDLYFCTRETVVLTRYGNEGQEYVAGLSPSTKKEELIEAKNRAIKLNLISSKDLHLI